MSTENMGFPAENKKHTELFHSEQKAVMPTDPRPFRLANGIFLLEAVITRNTAE